MSPRCALACGPRGRPCRRRPAPPPPRPSPRPPARCSTARRRARPVALYAARPDEVDTAPLDRAACARGLAVAYPRVVPGSLVLGFHLATPAELVPGAFGLHEPRADAPAVAVGALALVCLPGLGFDATGARLGSGRGYYDATLADAAGPVRVGLAFSCQLVARVPSAAHDVPVHHILTEAGARSASPR
ncbi:MAG: 5-formyltetrahydrofolate cyclo-ligase [Kofleriaceae bacterium]